MNTFNKIIIVSNEDKSRGPMAAAILGGLLKDRGFMIESRGLVVLFPEPYNPKAIDIGKQKGMNLQSTFSRQLEDTDFGLNTLVLTMEDSQKEKIYAKYPTARNVFTLCEFAGETGKEIPNPYGKDETAYRECFDELYGVVFKASDVLLGEGKTMQEKNHTGGVL